jgi:tetratricopeptide (TPR) repeat protein
MPGHLPESFGPYRIEEQLGAGGMGEVYRARDTRLGRDVAVKVITPGKAEDAGLQSRFEHEARAASTLNHPNIVCVYDVGEQNGTRFIVSELVHGESLRQMISRGPLPADQTVRIAEQIGDALKAAHAAGVVHRDLKPENLMVTSEGRVKVLDFGLARRIRRQSIADSAETQTTATQPGVVLGTAGYMSPEQICGEEADQRSDIFSVGVVLYEMTTGARAFRGRTSIETMSAVLRDAPPPLSSTAPGALERIIRRCLEKDPARRYQSASELVSALQSANFGTVSQARPRWIGWAAATAAAGVLAAGVYWQAGRKRPARPPAGTGVVSAPPPAPARAPQPAVLTAPPVAAQPPSPATPARPDKSTKTKTATEEAYQQAYEQGMLLLSQRKWAGAGERLHEATRLKPDSAAAYLGLCHAAMGLQDHQQAIADCTQVINRLPSSADAFHERGTAYLLIQQFNQSVEDMNAAIRLGDENRAVAFSVRGRAHSGWKEWGDAIRDFDEAIGLNPNVAQFFMFRGIALKARSQFRKAIDDFDEALRLQPNMPMAYTQRAQAKQRTGDLSGAAEDRKRAQSLRK